MSSADLDCPIKYTREEVTAILAFPLVDRLMRRPFTINTRDWDIPYLAGYSGDGRTIFIDRDIGKWMWEDRPEPSSPFLVLHEHSEKSTADAVRAAAERELQRLLILMRMEHADDQLYYHCHGIATFLEEYAVRSRFGDDGLKSYNTFMGGQVKRAGSELIRRVPQTLDMLPYGGEDPTDIRLRSEMEQKMAA